MNTEDNKELVRQFYDALEKEDYDTVASYCHEDFVFYFQVDSPIKGAEGFVESEKKNFDAFKGFTMRIHELLAENDKVAAYMIFEGPHNSAPVFGVEPKGNHVRFSLFMLLTIKDGKIIEKRAHFDQSDIRAQVAR
ncbi:ester cyclase [Pontibacter russatus]|uniref:ester cyclase n=1 Tax=Pontibacter russatus TaxID=2694929 RepID=UPI00137AF792|nr:ester cyclase [Pontibacter russatus]